MSDVELPGCLADIARVAGLPAALAVARRWGGAYLYVPEPRFLKPGHPLVEAVELDAALRIAEYFPAQRLEVPKADAWHASCRNAAIRQAYALGESQTSLALRYKLTTRHIRNIVGDISPEANLDLFS
jgi:hypothetical protein